MSDKDASGLVERLHARISMAHIAFWTNLTDNVALDTEAAALITSQAEEIERLREALKPFAVGGELLPEDAADTDAFGVSALALRRARTVLNGAQQK